MRARFPRELLRDVPFGRSVLPHRRFGRLGNEPDGHIVGFCCLSLVECTDFVVPGLKAAVWFAAPRSSEERPILRTCEFSSACCRVFLVSAVRVILRRATRSDIAIAFLLFCRSRDWHEGALAAANAEGLREKLGRVCASHECQGKISPFFAKKYGLNPE